jgi:hypothetical protein
MVRRDHEACCSRRTPCAARRVIRSTLAVVTCWLGACGGGGDDGPNPPGGDGGVDAAAPTWWQPKVGAAKNWDIQLRGTVDVLPPRTMYVLDLWDLVPEQTTIDYGDGDPVTVSPGAQAGTITELHARTPSTIVICYVEVGLLNLGQADARKFPGYNADFTKIPDNPTRPATDSVIGWSVGTPSARLLDAREASRARWAPILFKRFDLAKQIGCDGIAPGHSDVVQYESGFEDSAVDSYSLYTEIARQGRERSLSIGMMNGTRLSGQVDMAADKFDWLMIERCGEFDDCDSARPFINLDKAVLAIEYDETEEGAQQGATAVCMRQAVAMITDGIYKDPLLTSAVRQQCVP